MPHGTIRAENAFKSYDNIQKLTADLRLIIEESITHSSDSPTQVGEIPSTQDMVSFLNKMVEREFNLNDSKRSILQFIPDSDERAASSSFSNHRNNCTNQQQELWVSSVFPVLYASLVGDLKPVVINTAKFFLICHEAKLINSDTSKQYLLYLAEALNNNQNIQAQENAILSFELILYHLNRDMHNLINELLSSPVHSVLLNALNKLDVKYWKSRFYILTKVLEHSNNIRELDTLISSAYLLLKVGEQSGNSTIKSQAFIFFRNLIIRHNINDSRVYALHLGFASEMNKELLLLRNISLYTYLGNLAQHADDDKLRGYFIDNVVPVLLNVLDNNKDKVSSVRKNIYFIFARLANHGNNDRISEVLLSPRVLSHLKAGILDGSINSLLACLRLYKIKHSDSIQDLFCRDPDSLLILKKLQDEGIQNESLQITIVEMLATIFKHGNRNKTLDFLCMEDAQQALQSAIQHDKCLCLRLSTLVCFIEIMKYADHEGIRAWILSADVFKVLSNVLDDYKYLARSETYSKVITTLRSNQEFFKECSSKEPDANAAAASSKP